MGRHTNGPALQWADWPPEEGGRHAKRVMFWERTNLVQACREDVRLQAQVVAVTLLEERKRLEGLHNAIADRDSMGCAGIPEPIPYSDFEHEYRELEERIVARVRSRFAA